MNFCGEIQYEREDGLVHSDICFNCCNPSNSDRALTEDYRKFVHECLDEWLNKSNGTGFFYLANPQNIIENFRK